MTFPPRSVHVFTLALLLLGVRSGADSANGFWDVGQAVETTSGIILGHAASETTHVSEYLGIRYAKPPLGRLRFARPERFWNEREVFNASAFVRTSKVMFDFSRLD
jgi:hypothetical protein